MIYHSNVVVGFIHEQEEGLLEKMNPRGGEPRGLGKPWGVDGKELPVCSIKG